MSEAGKSFGDRLVSSFEEVIQWRRPVLSSFYLLCTNTAFWGCVFYLDNNQQLLALRAIASVLSSLCLLSTTIITAGGVITNARDSYQKWFGSADVQRNAIISGISKCIGVVFFSLESFFLPMFTITLSLFYQRPASIMAITGSLAASHYLGNEQQERACWTAYITVLLMVLVPPWRYNRVTEQILKTMGTIFDETFTWLRLNIIHPIGRFLGLCFRIIRYCVCGYWIPPLVSRITEFCRRVAEGIDYYFLDPIRRTFLYLKRIFVYWAFGHWIPPLVEYLKEKWHRLTGYIRLNVVEPIVAIYNRIRRFCVYWFGGYWIPPLLAYLVEKKNQLVLGFHRNVVDPIVLFFSDFKNNVKYILLGYWIPPFLAWFHRRVIDPLIDGIVRCYNTAEYILCGRWIPSFIQFLRRKALETRLYIEERLRRFKAYAIDRMKRTKEYCRQLVIRSVNYVKTQWIRPFIHWMKVTRTRIRLWLINEVFKPAWKGIKNQWRRFKFYVKHHILYPALRRAVYYVLSGIIYAWEHAVVPTFTVLGIYGALGKDYAWLHWGKPAAEWLRERLPEKSPLVDDSDTELQDFLPSDDEAEEEENESEDDGAHLHEPAGEPSAQSRVTRLKLGVARFLAADVGTSSEEEDEFAVGMNFPSPENADSDEEEERNMIPRKLSSTSSTVQGRRKRSSKDVSSARSDPSTSTEPAQITSLPSDPKPQSGPSTAQGSVEKREGSGTAKTKKEESISATKPGPVQSSDKRVPNFEPDFEMIDHNDVDS